VTLQSKLKSHDIYSEVTRCLTTSDTDIRHILNKHHYTIDDLAHLISPAAEPYIEDIAARAHLYTQQRFGNTMQLFAPMYLSNECYNTCTYCGFSREYKYKRTTLSDNQIISEAKQLKKKGFDHILLLTGESPKKVGVNYIENAIKLISPYFSSIGIEVQPLQTDEYSQLIHSGCDSLTLYQETYHRESYQSYHLFGIKKNYDNRLAASERGGKAKFYRLNLGVLLGLYDWRYDSIALATHLKYMMTQYWQTHYSVSFPRIKDMVGQFTIDYPVSDIHLVQLICAFRLCFPTVGITLSTREPATLRNHLCKLGITTMSAESETAPGGYSEKLGAEEQFKISDNRSLKEIVTTLKQNNMDPVFKDWN
jgi:2-iminoacetate synthase